MAHELRGVGDWTKKLSQMELPVLADVIAELNKLADDDDSGAEQLSSVILKDATLTSQVLRIANSAMFNPGNYTIATISRAVVLIGFCEVRSICISAMIIDTLLGTNPREHLLESLARSFHAAIQAKNIAVKMNSQIKEEIFIATLLYHLGEMAFWSCGKEYADKADLLLRNPDANLQLVSDEITGCSFKQLTKELAKTWGLSGLLIDSLSASSAPQPKVVAVQLGERVSQTAKHGWDSVEMKKVLKKIVAFTGIDLSTVKDMVKSSANEAASAASVFGASRLSRLIPSTKKQKVVLDDSHEPEVCESILEPNQDLQLKVLREMSSLVMEKVDINVVFQTLLEGLHRGVGLERVAILLLNPKQKVLEAKFVLGTQTESLRKNLLCKVDKTSHENIFSLMLNESSPHWVGKEENRKFDSLNTPVIRKIIGEGGFFVAPVILGPRHVGVAYADMHVSSRPLSSEQYDSFQHFLMQTNMCLTMLLTR